MRFYYGGTLFQNVKLNIIMSSNAGTSDEERW